MGPTSSSGGTSAGIPPEVAAVVLRSAEALIAVLDDDGRIILANPATEEATGYLVAELLGRRFWDHVVDDDVAQVRDAVRAVVTTAIPAQVECHWRGKTGRDPLLAWSLRGLANDRGIVTHIVATGLDVTEGRAVAQELAERDAELELLTRTLPIGYYAAFSQDGTFLVTTANERFNELVGATPSPHDPIDLLSYIHPDDVPVVAEALEELASTPHDVERDVRVVRPDETIRWVRSRGAAVTADDGRVIGGVGWLIDITREVEARDEARRLHQLVDESVDIVLLLTPAGGVRYANAAARTAAGTGTAPPDHLHDVVDEESTSRFFREVIPALGAHGQWRGEMAARTPDGGTVPVSQLFLAHEGRSLEPGRISMIARDISEAKELEQHLTHLAFHDPLTGLPNRALVLDRLGQALDRSSRSQSQVAVMFLDMDFFKSINDELGHDAGDMLLRSVADRLNAAVRPGDTVSRLGGDEFVILCESVGDTREALRIAERIRATLAEPFVIGGRELTTSGSIGVAMAQNNQVGAASLLTQADAAAYRAKERGRNRYEQYQPD